jgi:hypothetical protein
VAIINPKEKDRPQAIDNFFMNRFGNPLTRLRPGALRWKRCAQNAPEKASL